MTATNSGTRSRAGFAFCGLLKMLPPALAMQHICAAIMVAMIYWREGIGLDSQGKDVSSPSGTKHPFAGIDT
jgi:hypothetical protein